MVYWNEEGFKVGLCAVPPLNQQYALLGLANNCCVRVTFKALRDRFMKLYSTKAYLHHYAEHLVGEELFKEALAGVDDLIADYARCEGNVEPPEFVPGRLVVDF